MPQRSEDSKVLAIKHYLNSDKTQEEIADIFDVSIKTVKHWTRLHQEKDSLQRKKRIGTSYKIKKKHVDYAIKCLKKNQSLSTILLHKMVSKKYNYFDISPDHLHHVIRDNNIT